MALTVNDFLLGPSRVSDDILKGVVDRLDRPDLKDSGFLVALRNWCRVAGVDDANAISQWLWETDNARAPRWNRDFNPSGIGITSDGTVQPFKINGPDEAARLFVQCIYSMVRKEWHPEVPIPERAQSWMDGIWLKKVRNPAYPKAVERVKHQNLIYYTPDGDWHATWAADQSYLLHVARGNQFMPSLPNQMAVVTPTPPPSKEGPMVLANFRASIIPSGNRNRPGFLLNTNDREIGITQHTTGNTNPGANAEMHRVFTHNGGGPERVSFHFTVDDREIIQLLPLYEGAYHAADGCDNRNTDYGCFDTVAIELCVNAGANWAKAKDNLARLYAMLWTGDARLVGIDRVTVVPGRVYTHQQVSDTNKYCPTQLLNEGSLPTIIAQGQQYANTVPPDTYAPPLTYDWLDRSVAAEGLDRKIGNTTVYYLPGVYTAVRETPRRRATGDNTQVIGPPIEKGERFACDYTYRSHGVTWLLTPYGTRIRASDVEPKVQISLRGTISVRKTASSKPSIARRAGN
jgi:hypothetical protein